MGGNGASLDQGQELGDGCWRAFGFAFHLAVPIVAYPADQAQSVGAFESEGAEADSLDIAGNEEMNATEVVVRACGCNFAVHVEEI